MIRPAIPEDAAAVAPLIVQAMGPLAGKLIFSNVTEAIIQIFEQLFKQRKNQYSFENTLVYAEGNQVLGSINAYDGALLLHFRKNLMEYLKATEDNNTSEVETQEGEFYFDTISVNPKAQGIGIGKQLIQAGISWAKAIGHTDIGLLVDVNNVRALRLYESFGFKITHGKRFMSELYYHLSYKVL